MAHPLRVRILGALEKGEASPSELAQELEAPLGTVSYHVRQLAELKLIKLVKRTPRRGAVEHHYRLEARPSISEEAWGKAPPFVKEAYLSAVLSQAGDDVMDAAGSGGFDREDIHLSRLPLTLDGEGFFAVARELEALVQRLKEIEQDSRKRLERVNHDGQIQAKSVLMLFESPTAVPPAGEATAPRGKRASAEASA
jgi:DNA-binding transcriptional ArsR family regulator